MVTYSNNNTQRLSKYVILSYVLRRIKLLQIHLNVSPTTTKTDDILYKSRGKRTLLPVKCSRLDKIFYIVQLLISAEWRRLFPGNER